jgi:hypothetical protein
MYYPYLKISIEDVSLLSCFSIITTLNIQLLHFFEFLNPGARGFLIVLCVIIMVLSELALWHGFEKQMLLKSILLLVIYSVFTAFLNFGFLYVSGDLLAESIIASVGAFSLCLLISMAIIILIVIFRRIKKW